MRGKEKASRVGEAGGVVRIDAATFKSDVLPHLKTLYNEISRALILQIFFVRLLGLLSAMHKQHEEFAATPQCCGVGVVLEPRCSWSSDSSLPARPLGTRHRSSGHAFSSSCNGLPPTDSPELDSSCDVPCDEFVVSDLLEGFSGATSCALQRGDRVLSIDGVDVSGMTESAAGINKVPKLIPPRLSIDGVDGGGKSEKAEGTCDDFFGEMGVLMQSW